MFESIPGLWPWAELCQALALKPAPGPTVQRVVCDSRQIQPGDLFIALPGDPGPRFNPAYRSMVDGHDFVAAAAEQGAVAAMVHRSVSGADELALLETSDTYDGLWQLGRAAAARHAGHRVAITGSSGKTTAKTMLAAATAGYASPGSYNNHIGVPLSLLNLPPQAQIAALEVGTNHPGEIEPLAAMIKPEVAVLLNVHSAHLENFSNWQALRGEKLNIFNALENKSNAVWEESLALSTGFCFGRSRGANARLLEIEGDLARIDLFGQALQARIPGGGEHRALTLAATLLVLKILEFDLAAALALPESLVPAGRGRVHRFGSSVLVDESYNANPESMRATLLAFAQRPEARKAAVIGEMLELGERSEAAHQELADVLAGMQVYCVGEGTKVLAEQLGSPWFAVADEALLGRIDEYLEAPGAILIKGSNRVFWQHQFVERVLQKHS